jgi:hypothetical protein
MNDVWSRWVVFLIVLALSTVIALTTTHPSPSPQCVLGEVKNCTVHNCSGYQVCRSNGWSECIVIKQCKPGETSSCYLPGCGVGVRVCDACGRWSNCSQR